MKKKILSVCLAAALFVLALTAVPVPGVSDERISLAKASDGEEEPEEQEQTKDYMSDYFDENYLFFSSGDYTYTDRISAYLFMGTDHSGSEDDTGEDYRGSMADFLMVLILNSTDQTYALIQLNRDTMADVCVLDDEGESTGYAEIQLCTAHWYGIDKEQSCENTEDAVSGLLGELEFDGYYALPMDHIAELNHAVGGVTLTVQDDFSKVDPSLVEGETVTLTDEQAATYIRARYDVGDEENLSRMARQKQFLQAFTVQAKQMLKEDPSFAMDTVDELEPYSTTDLNGNAISKIINRLSKYDSLGIFELEGEAEVGQALGDGVDHVEYYVEEDTVVALMKELFHMYLDED